VTRRTKGWAFVAAAVVAAATAVGVPASTPKVAAAPADEIVAVVVDGVGNGHGRGLSQWGAYGRAVNAGQTWQQIIATYYGGTTLGGAANETIGVRLLALDGASTTGVFVPSGIVTWNGSQWASLKAVEEAPGIYDVYGSPSVACPDDPVSWTALGEANVVTFTGGDATPAGSIGVCRPDGSVVHYRGAIRVQDDSEGNNRTVNDVAIEDYLNGVVPREVSASWGLAGGGSGMHALRAQAVAARSYALAQNRYSYAKTCDSSSCQVYGGAARRSSATDAAPEVLESNLTNQAIAETAGVILVKDGPVVSAEFSASNGPRTAGGAFPAVDDPWDDVPANPLHRWTRVLDAGAVASKFGLGTLTAAWTEPDPSTSWEGAWDNRVRLVGTSSSTTVSALDFRSQYGLPSHGISVRVVTRGMISPQDFAFIGDSVGASITGSDEAELPALLDGIFATARYDAVSSRCTVGNCTAAPDGLGVAGSLEQGTELVIVELGYNDPSANYGTKIDQVMTALRAKGVQRVGWVNVSTRKSATFANVNNALSTARQRWPELVVLDWNAASSGAQRDRWFTDGVHLTNTGQSEFALWLRSQVLSLATAGPGKLPGGEFLRVPVRGVGDVPPSGVTAVALNVTAVDPSAWGFFTVWPCGSPMPPNASHVNFINAGAVEPNSVLAPVDGTGEVCVWTYASSHVLVDVNGWFTSGFQGQNPNRIVDTRSGQGAPAGKLGAKQVMRVRVAGAAGMPGGATAVALNVTAVEPTGWGYFTVWPCGSPMPNASHVNFVSVGAVEPNSVLMPIDATGEICVWTYASSHVLVDVNGWFTSGFQGQAPVRIVDTREGMGAPRAKLAAGQVLRVPVSGVANVPGSGVTAVAVNVTAAETAGWGFFTVWPCDSPMPNNASHVNFVRAGAVEPNSVLMPVDGSGAICIWTFADAHVLVDVNGWFTSGFEGRAPERFVDTRSGQFGPL
jgi:peptidoglycan hydrolase-like amidase